jgi:hypothetical protein
LVIRAGIGTFKVWHVPHLRRRQVLEWYALHEPTFTSLAPGPGANCATATADRTVTLDGDGSTLLLTIAGTIRDQKLAATFTIVGGTGVFAGAAGGGTLSGVGTGVPTPSDAVHLRGTITLSPAPPLKRTSALSHSTSGIQVGGRLPRRLLRRLTARHGLPPARTSTRRTWQPVSPRTSSAGSRRARADRSSFVRSG